MNIPPFALIVTAAGSSSRFLSDETLPHVKKEFLSIDGHTVLYRATEPFFELGSLSAVVITYEKDCLDETIVALEDLADLNSVPMLFSEGGETRAESIRNALTKLNEFAPETKFVAIHDGARPFVTPSLIIRTFASATVDGASVPAIFETDTIKRINEAGIISESIERKGVVRVQTPQFFDFHNLLKAYENASLDATDDSTLYVAAGFTCSVTLSDESNRKITYIDDIPDAKSQIEEYDRVRAEGRKSAAAVRRFRELANMKEEQL
jgi:4-diphosphocytidyl-2-methyl-D-erithritol synthase